MTDLDRQVAELERAETERIEWVKRAEQAEEVNDELREQLASLTRRWTTARPAPKDFEWWLWRPDRTARFYAVLFNRGLWYFGDKLWAWPLTGEWSDQPIALPEEAP